MTTIGSLCVYCGSSTGHDPAHRRAAAELGRLLAASRTSDIADAHIVICARRSQQRVITSDPGDLHALDPALQLITL